MPYQYANSKLKIFSLNSNNPLAEEIADEIGVPLGKSSVTHLVMEKSKLILKKVFVVCDVFIVQSTSAPVNEHLMELLIMIDAVKRASARTINVVMPYYGYARQDRKAKAREPITAKLVANLLETAGATRVIVLDLHAPQIQGFFDILIDHLVAVPFLSDYFETKDFNPDELVIVSPDHGGVTRARKMAERLKAPIAIIDKRRPKPNVAEVMNIVGNVEGKICILIDDIIDTAGTITIGAEALMVCRKVGCFREGVLLGICPRSNHVSCNSQCIHKVIELSLYEHLICIIEYVIRLWNYILMLFILDCP